MSGLKLVIPTTFTDNTLPILRDDPMLNVGSLIMLEPNHPARPLAAGVPANNGPIPNIAHKELNALLGGTYSVGDLDPKLVYPGSFSGTKAKLERSGKGGIHGIVSQAVALASGDGAMTSMFAALNNYIKANYGHSYYFSFWDRITRINAGTLPGTAAGTEGVIESSTAVSKHLMMQVGTQMLNGSGTPGGSRVGTNAVGPRFGNLALVGPLNSFDSATATLGAMWGAYSGTYNAAVLASRNSFWPSFVFYRFTIEDLTVSGRTYAQADAADFAEYTKQVLTPGGRYYGDTFTDPATIP
jgi:hypothetical protein